VTQRPDETQKEGRTTPLVVDRFTTDVARGRVNGTTDSGSATSQSPAAVRHITDAERMISIDHGALRIPMLAKPGFGRAALSYGPFTAKPGLAMAVWMLNGHNTSQTLHTYSLLKQAYRFLRGGNAFSIPEQLAGWCRHPARESLWRRVECWVGVRFAKNANVKDNLMVGFFTDATKPTLGSHGSAFVMHAASHECGDLRSTSTGRMDPGSSFTPQADNGTSIAHGFQNVDALYVVVLREDSAISYLAATPGARGAAAVGMMRPVAIERRSTNTAPPSPTVFAGVHQAVLGEIGFAVDSRVHAIIVDHLPECASRFAGAHAANASPSHSAEQFRQLVAPTGLLSAWLAPSSTPTGIVFRAVNLHNHWSVVVRTTEAGTLVDLAKVHDGSSTIVASATMSTPPGHCQLLILDDGDSIAVRFAGQVIGPHAIRDPLHAVSAGIGIVGDSIRDFEAHPREVPIPPQFRVHEFWAPKGSRELIRDDFADSSATTPTELDNGVVPVASTATPTTQRPTWQRTFGSGRFDILPTSSGGGTKVRGEPGNPCPMRTLYTLPWSNPAFADIETTMTPPGTGRFQRQAGRSGLVLWQDKRNHLIVNLWLHDGYDGASISSFLVFDGFDDVYNAVWTNSGSRVTWNKPFRMNVTFDGDRYLVRVNDEPVLYRRVTDVYPRANRFNITRVGLASNWEWGLDTGTLFHNFIARDV
jgi:hypothetical protein